MFNIVHAMRHIWYTSSTGQTWTWNHLLSDNTLPITHTVQSLE